MEVYVKGGIPGQSEDMKPAFHEGATIYGYIGLDLILMDVGLPYIDGLEATKIIKATGRCKDTPVIAVTAFSGMRGRAFAAGCVDLVEKPLELSVLEGLMQVHLGSPMPGHGHWLQRPLQTGDMSFF